MAEPLPCDEGEVGCEPSDLGEPSDPGGGSDSGGDQPPEPTAADHIIYLNFDGGIFVSGGNDSINDETPIFLPAKQVDLPPALLPAQQADAIVACVEQLVAPFSFDVVTRDPGEVDHVEVVFSEVHSRDLGLPSGVAAIGAMPTAEDYLARPIGFVFLEEFPLFVPGEYPDVPTGGCQSAGWILGLATGLSPTADCRDSMTYPREWCGSRAFLDEEIACANAYGGPTACIRGGDSQNGFQRLLEVYGPRR